MLFDTLIPVCPSSTLWHSQWDTRVWSMVLSTFPEEIAIIVQSNLNSSNTDGSFTMANSNTVLSPFKILPLAQENKHLGKFSYFIMKLYVLCTTYNYCEWNKKKTKLSLFTSWPGTMNNPQWLELPMSRTIFYGPKDVRAIEVRL